MRFSAAVFSSMAAVHCADGARVRAGALSLTEADSELESTTVEEILSQLPKGIKGVIDGLGKSSVDCSNPDTVPGAWNEGGMKAGVRAGMWKFSKYLACEEGTAKTTSWPHAYAVPANESAASGDLVLFLAPEGRLWYYYTRLIAAAADAGHYVFSPTYLSTPVPIDNVNQWCDPDPLNTEYFHPGKCNQEIHEQILFGDENVEADVRGKSGKFWAVPEKDSVVQLTISSLKKVEWGKKFLTEKGGLNWDKIIVSGHSQGASHAAYLSQVKGVRAVLFSGPQDSLASAKEWTRLTKNGKQPSAGVKRRSLYHKHEECGDEPKNPAIVCENRLQETLLAKMGFGPKTFWDGGDELPSSLENVVATMMYPDHKVCAKKARKWLDVTAANTCAPPEMEKIWKAMFSDMSGDAAALVEETSAVSAIPVNVRDCGTRSHVAKIQSYSPRSIRQGTSTTITAVGTISEDVAGGTVNIKIKMTGFPYTTLADLKKHNICQYKKLELRALGVWGGTMEYPGMPCPLKKSQGSIKLPIKMTLASALPGGLANVEASLDATASNNKPLLCAKVTTSR